MKKMRNVRYYIAGVLSLTTFLVYLKSLSNGFVGWDDTTYVSNNPYIRSFDWTFLKWAFFNFYSYNWLPLTWISHALDYALWGMNPLGHHLTNNVLHAGNTFFAVLLAARLLEEARGTGVGNRPSMFLNERTILIASAVTGLLFGLHPLHVESVAWIAERKDLLCALFFLLSLSAYAKYAGSQGAGMRDQKSKINRGEKADRRNSFVGRHYFSALVFFALALLSKPMAVSLPLILLVLDWYPFRRILSLKSFWAVLPEKVPFAVLGLLSSVVTMLAQKSGGAIWGDVPLQSRALVAARSLVGYLWHIVAPFNLLPFYPYPRNVSFFSLQSVAAVVLVLGITAVCFVMEKKQKLWLAVWGYYVITLIPVLGIVQAGGQAMADRYTYLPSLGPFLVVGLFIAWVSGKAKTLASGTRRVVKTAGAGLVVCLFLSMSYLTFQQIGIWKNGLELWTYVIRKEPERVLFAYYNRALVYAKLGRYPEAIRDYSKVIALNYEEYSQVYLDRGLTYLKVGQVNAAFADLKRACDLGNDFGCKALQYIEKKEH